MQTLIIIPTYNERDNIESLINQILSLDSDIGVLVVDDNSSDGTGQIVDKIRERESRLSVIHRVDRKGRGLAGIVGFKYAVEQDVDYVLEMDADFSHNPADIPRFIREIQNCDVVVGSRLISGGKICGRSFFRNVLTCFAQFYIDRILELGVKDNTSGFRCYKRKCLGEIDFDKFISTGPAILEEMLFYFKKKGFKIKEIPIVFCERSRGYSKLNIVKIFRVLFTVIKLRLK